MLKKVILFGLIISLLGFVGCGQTNEDKKSNEHTKIEVVGSSSVTPLMEKLAEDYNKTVPEVKINIQGVGSSAGIKAATDGTADIGMSSRDLKDTEKGLNENKIALDPIAVIINPKNSVADLKIEQITDIFKGIITNWKDVGGADKPIIIVSREEGSGTRDAFEEMVKLISSTAGKTISLVSQDANIADGNGAVLQNIATKENAIGYVSLGVVNSSVKVLKIGSIESTEENVKSGYYKISRDFLILTKGEPKEETKKFIEYILSVKGQAIVKESGYLPFI